MATSVRHPALASVPAQDQAIRYLRLAWLVSFAMVVTFRMMWLMRTSSETRSAGWALDLIPVVLLYGICGWRLLKPEPRVSIGVALAIAAQVLVRRLYYMLVPPAFPPGFHFTPAMEMQRMIAIFVNVGLAFFAIQAWRSLKTDRARPILGLAIGFAYYPVTDFVVKAVTPFVDFLLR